MRKIVMISLLVIFIFSLLGCSTSSEQKYYYVLVVEGKEDLMKKFDKYVSIQNPVIEIDYYKHLKDAKKQHPSYTIEETPVVYIFSISRNTKQLILNTNDVERSLHKLQAIKEQKIVTEN